MIPTVRPADHRYRKQLLLSVLIILGIGLSGLWWCLQYLDRLEAVAMADPKLALERMEQMFRIMTVLGMLDLSGGGVFILWLGQRTLRSGCYPPPEAPVIRDTVVLYGPLAQRRGRLLFVLGNGILAGAILGGFLLLGWLRTFSLTG